MTRDGSIHDVFRATPPGPVVLVTNPQSEHAVGAARLAELFATAGVRVGQHIAVGDLARGSTLGRIWRDRGFHAAVAAGGDGTIGAVATQLAGSGLPLGIVPLGTSNDIARALGIPLDSTAACATIAQGSVAYLPLGQAISMSNGAPAGSTPAVLPAGARMEIGAPVEMMYFVHALTLGLNVTFAQQATDAAHRARWGRLSYAAAAIEALAHTRPFQARLSFPDSTPTDRLEGMVAADVLEVAVLNLPLFGGALQLHLPEASPGHLLDIVLIELLDARRLRELIGALLAALERWGATSSDDQSPTRHVAAALAAGFEGETLAPGVRRYRARAAIIETSQPSAVALDGEVLSHTPLRVELGPESLRVFVPARRPAAIGETSG